MRRRLVEREEPRLLAERPRERDALALAAGQRGHGQRRQVEHPRLRHRLPASRAVGLALEEPFRRVRVAAHQHRLGDRER